MLKPGLCIFVLIAGSLLAACYQIPVNQGNRIEQTAVDQLEIGMSKEQVRFLMGAPILQEPFNQNRWNYLSRYMTKTGDYKERRIILYFRNDVLAEISGDVAPIKEEENREPEQESIL